MMLEQEAAPAHPIGWLQQGMAMDSLLALAARLGVRLGQTMGLLCKEESPFSSQLPLFLEIVKPDLRKIQQLKALRLVFSLCKAAGGSLFFSLLHISSSSVLCPDRKPVALKTSTCSLGGLRCYVEIVGLGQFVSWTCT